METLKVQKVATTTSSIATSGTTSAKSHTSGTSPSLSVRFNAGEESIDGLLQSYRSNNNKSSNAVTVSAPIKTVQVATTSGRHASGYGGSNVCTSGGAGDGKNAGVASSSQSLNMKSTSVSDAGVSSTMTTQHQQNVPEELNARPNFLQGNFFSRKRSGSIESVSPTSLHSNTLIPSASIEAASGGTWKMIKGKVSQTIEDIKSSKASSSTSSGINNIISTANLSIPAVIVKECDPSHQIIIEKGANLESPHSFNDDTSALKQDQSINISSDRQKLRNKIDGWDTDLNTEILYDLQSEQSRLKRGFASFKSKVKSKQQSSNSPNLHILKRDDSPRQNISSSSSFRHNFMRRRRYDKDDENMDQPNNSGSNITNSPITAPLTAVAAVASAPVEITTAESNTAIPVVISGKADKRRKRATNKEVEIESGVEMMEETIPSLTSILSMPKENFVIFDNQEENMPTVYASNPADGPTENNTQPPFNINQTNEYTYSRNSISRRLLTTIKSLPTFSVAALAVVFVLPINSFIRGMLACLLSINISQGIIKSMTVMIDNFLLSQTSERVPFRTPDYRKMPTCTVPAIKEQLKYYDEWMHEIDEYDPLSFQVSQTSGVYVRLEGSMLHVFSTTTRIPKRMLWNEKPFDLKTIIFNTHRTYNLRGCRVELLPAGLAKKRHFSIKYPIQLIVNTSKYTFTDLDEYRAKKKGNVKIEKSKKPDRTAVKNPKVHFNNDKTMEKADIDLGETLLNADLQKLQNDVNPDSELETMSVPTGDEVRLLLFARACRQKEDWLRHFIAARDGDIYDKEIRIPSVRFVDNSYLEKAAERAAELSTKGVLEDYVVCEEEQPTTSKGDNSDDDDDEGESDAEDDIDDIVDTIEGLIMTASASRTDPKFIYFMSLYQQACNQTRIPVYKKELMMFEDGIKHRKRSVRNQNTLWKSIDQSLFLGPSGSVVWANVLSGRFLFSILQNDSMIEKIKELFQKKINSFKLPSFMEEVIITNIDLGNKPPLIHRVSQPLIDERGIWIDADITYDGLCHITITTKLNLVRLKRPAEQTPMTNETLKTENKNTEPFERVVHAATSTMALYDSDAESTASSSTDSEFVPMTNEGIENLQTAETSTPHNARRLFKFVDKLIASNFFQYATEISYVQKTLENMNTTITLRLDVRGLVARLTINLPPPPSDRIWLGFRAPPRLWITARPAFGEKAVDWSILTNIIEGKIIEACSKYLVVPNMIDIAVPILGKSATEL